MAKKQIMAHITAMTNVTQDIYSMWIQAEGIASTAEPGQFVSLYCNNQDRLLPRPISICEINREEELLRLVFRIAGKGTKEFSKMRPGDTIKVLGPLGNGFPKGTGKSILIGGGIGIPPMLELGKELKGDITAVLGYRDSDLFLKDDFLPYAKVLISTEDGSVGTKGNVIDAIRQNYSIDELKNTTFYACGPTPMLRGVKAFCAENDITAYLSLEEKMACGIGACLACTCQSTEVDAHSNVHNKRICKDGPVFLSTEVSL